MADTAYRMSGARKAALLLVALGQERAARIVQALHSDEVEEVMAEIANLGPWTNPSSTRS